MCSSYNASGVAATWLVVPGIPVVAAQRVSRRCGWRCAADLGDDVARCINITRAERCDLSRLILYMPIHSDSMRPLGRRDVCTGRA